jgi:hypothetical protein
MRAIWEFDSSECKLLANAIQEMAQVGAIEGE